MDNNCVLLKKKEYEELKKQAESKKPDYIRIDITGIYNYMTGYHEGIDSSINLSDGIIQQINGIRRQIKEVYEGNLEHIRNKLTDVEARCDKYDAMDFWERLKWAFSKKNQVK